MLPSAPPVSLFSPQPVRTAVCTHGGRLVKAVSSASAPWPINLKVLAIELQADAR